MPAWGGAEPHHSQGDHLRKLYHGLADGTVLVREEEVGSGPTWRRLSPRLDLRSHSLSGFVWGYGGSGPAQLALALACDVLGSDECALQLYQGLKLAFVARLPQGGAWGPVSADELRLDLAEIGSGGHDAGAA